MQQQFIFYMILHPWIRFFYLYPFCDKVYILHDIASLNQILLSVSILWQGLYSKWYCTLESDSFICIHSVTTFIFYITLHPWIRFYYLCPFCDKVYILHDIASLNQILLSVSILWQGLYSTWCCTLESDSIICVHSVTRFIFYMILCPWIRFYYLCPFCDKVYILHIAPLNQILLSVSILWQGLYSTWYCVLESDSIICVHSVTRFIFYVILRTWIRFYYLCPFCDRVTRLVTSSTSSDIVSESASVLLWKTNFLMVFLTASRFTAPCFLRRCTYAHDKYMLRTMLRQDTTLSITTPTRHLLKNYKQKISYF